MVAGNATDNRHLTTVDKRPRTQPQVEWRLCDMHRAAV